MKLLCLCPDSLSETLCDPRRVRKDCAFQLGQREHCVTGSNLGKEDSVIYGVGVWSSPTQCSPSGPFLPALTEIKLFCSSSLLSPLWGTSVNQSLRLNFPISVIR